MSFLVTGARGRVGRRVLGRLVEAGEEVTASGRDVEALDVPAGAGAARLDLEDPDSIGNALDGVRGVFLYVTRQGLDGFVDAARHAGVRRIVLLSSGAVLEPDADTNPIAILHRRSERAVEESGIPHTILRPGAFATNALDWTESIRAESTVRVAYPDARVGAVHEDDIAAVAVEILRHGGHEGESLVVTGPEAISLREQVRILGEVLGRPIALDEVDLDEARKLMGGPRNIPEPVAEVLLASWARAVDTPSPVTDVVETVTGVAPRDFRRWAHDHRADFRS